MEKSYLVKIILKDRSPRFKSDSKEEKRNINEMRGFACNSKNIWDAKLKGDSINDYVMEYTNKKAAIGYINKIIDKKYISKISIQKQA
jgi:hypothetical protein